MTPLQWDTKREFIRRNQRQREGPVSNRTTQPTSVSSTNTIVTSTTNNAVMVKLFNLMIINFFLFSKNELPLTAIDSCFQPLVPF